MLITFQNKNVKNLFRKLDLDLVRLDLVRLDLVRLDLVRLD